MALFEPLYRRWPLTVSGALEAALHARGSVRAPQVGGTLRVVEPLVVRGKTNRLDLSLTEGRISLSEGRLRGTGLQLVGHGARLRLTGEAPAGPGADRNRPSISHSRGRLICRSWPAPSRRP